MLPTIPSGPRRQRGAVVLTVAVILLFAVTLVVIFTSQSTRVEQRISANELRAQQAFEAAEAGLDDGLVQLTKYGAGHLHDADNDLQVEIDTDDDGTGDTTSFTDTLTNGASYTVTFELLAAGDFDTLRVRSAGASDDGTGQSTVQSLVRVASVLRRTPDVPITARTTVDLGGNVAVTNNFGGQTVWSGGETTLTGSATTQPSVGTGSDSSAQGTDITENDASLAATTPDEFFGNFFGATKADVKAQSVLYTGGGNYSGILDGVQGRSIWIDAQGGDVRFNANTVIGSTTSPVVLVVENMSQLRINGTLEIYGLLYVIGDWDNAGGGTATIYGAAACEGAISSTGTPDVYYDPTVLGQTNQVGHYGRIPGTWRDF